MIIDQNEEVHFTQNEAEKKYKIYMIADASGTSPIVVYDELINNINLKETYVFTQIKTKKLHNNNILFTNSTTTIAKSNTVSNKPNILVLYKFKLSLYWKIKDFLRVKIWLWESYR